MSFLRVYNCKYICDERKTIIISLHLTRTVNTEISNWLVGRSHVVFIVVLDSHHAPQFHVVFLSTALFTQG